jgi:hypothetical protein
MARLSSRSSRSKRSIGNRFTEQLLATPFAHDPLAPTGAAALLQAHPSCDLMKAAARFARTISLTKQFDPYMPAYANPLRALS